MWHLTVLVASERLLRPSVCAAGLLPQLAGQALGTLRCYLGCFLDGQHGDSRKEHTHILARRCGRDRSFARYHETDASDDHVELTKVRPAVDQLWTSWSFQLRVRSFDLASSADLHRPSHDASIKPRASSLAVANLGRGKLLKPATVTLRSLCRYAFKQQQRRHSAGTAM